MGALANDDDGYREYSTLVVCPGVFGVADDLVACFLQFRLATTGLWRSVKLRCR